MEELRDDVRTGQDDDLGGSDVADLRAERPDRLLGDGLAGDVRARLAKGTDRGLEVGAGLRQQLALDLLDVVVGGDDG